MGRPRGYVEPPAGAVASNMGAAQMFAASLASQPTRCLLLDNMLKAVQVLDDEERGEVSLMTVLGDCAVLPHAPVQVCRKPHFRNWSKPRSAVGGCLLLPRL